MMSFQPVTPTPPDAAPLYVHPGRTLASADADSFTTVVGTGAAVCIWDPVNNVGGMSHFLLPEVGSAPPAPRFGDIAMKTLIDELAKLGAQPRRLRASVYGGSAPPVETTGMHLGDRNIEKALQFLGAHGVPVLERDVGGNGARKIVFNARQGKTEVVKIGKV